MGYTRRLRSKRDILQVYERVDISLVEAGGRLKGYRNLSILSVKKLKGTNRDILWLSKVFIYIKKTKHVQQLKGMQTIVGM